MAEKVSPGAKYNILHCMSMAEYLTDKRMFHCCEFRTVASSSEAVGVTSHGSTTSPSRSFVHFFFFLAVALQKRFECTLWRHF